LKRKEELRMPDRKVKRDLMELVSLRHRAHPHTYDKKVLERKRRLTRRIRRLKAPESEATA
jgi:hypothetical protein